MKAEPTETASPKTHTNPMGPDTTNMVVNVKKAFRDACFAAACDARMKLSEWMRAAFEEKLAREAAAKDPAQLKLEVDTH